VRYQVFPRSIYVSQVTHVQHDVYGNDGAVPLDLLEARNAVRIARDAHADQYAPEILKRAETPVHVRILAATNRGLEKAVAQGSFRLDLFYRLNVLNLRVPPLRERREDIPLLAAKFLEQSSRASEQQYELSGEAIQALIAHGWPGNVRELENCIERCCAMNSGPIIHIVDLPNSISGALARPTPNGTDERVVPLSVIEKRTILKTITQLNGDKMMAAKLLGIGKTTLYRKLKKYEAAL